jgi:hypothetical protein
MRVKVTVAMLLDFSTAEIFGSKETPAIYFVARLWLKGGAGSKLYLSIKVGTSWSEPNTGNHVNSASAFSVNAEQHVSRS